VPVRVRPPAPHLRKSPVSEIVDRFRVAVAVVFASALLAACSSQSATTEDNVGSFMVAPGKYEFYTCAHLALQTTAMKTRESELAALIAKAGPDAGGSFVSAIAYRPEYIQARGNLIEIRKAEVAQNCPPQVVEAPAAVIPPKGKKR
jgi:hypothetical protein